MTAPELPEEAIEVAEVRTGAHSHAGLGDDPDSLRAHLASAHDLDAPTNLSGSTLHGLHDRLHQEADAADG